MYDITITTAQIGKVPLGPTTIDITVKAKNSLFAPTWDMVMAYKNGKMSEAVYSEMYKKMMRWSYITHKKEWHDTITNAIGSTLTLTCYCKPGDFCHRILLQKYLTDVAVSMGYKVNSLLEVSLSC